MGGFKIPVARRAIYGKAKGRERGTSGSEASRGAVGPWSRSVLVDAAACARGGQPSVIPAAPGGWGGLEVSRTLEPENSGLPGYFGFRTSRSFSLYSVQHPRLMFR